MQPPLHEEKALYESVPAASYLAALNQQQRIAVDTIEAPVIIVAGPGTGKTRTLTVRIAHLVQAKGVAPEQILAITFTNKAAGEILERLRGLLGEATAARLTIETFHAFGAQLLRTYAAAEGSMPFAIAGEEDQRALLKEIVPDGGEKAISTLLAQIAAAKDQLWRLTIQHWQHTFPRRRRWPALRSLRSDATCQPAL
ncbi:MAG: UvrD-helicase domain-containing protein [Caldilineaceae bacterium]